MKKVTMTREEIEQYYGSVEAYNEEQRRCGLYEIETESRESNIATVAALRSGPDGQARSGGKLSFGQRMGRTFARGKKQPAS